MRKNVRMNGTMRGARNAWKRVGGWERVVCAGRCIIWESQIFHSNKRTIILFIECMCRQRSLPFSQVTQHTLTGSIL